ncbi:hypothetical protein PanWU01x14_330260 [Parasponia andersonii]|uniref:Uncharacterized protein n=1 Tax=Parasponia andersonii TaxID=3476 RepID=A0A2P5AI18_PARAD|nr:hypothetical protein PanWU01x14_330260 [Parasponia andersonii]
MLENDSAEAESVFRQDPVVSFGVPLVAAVLKVNELHFESLSGHTEGLELYQREREREYSKSRNGLRPYRNIQTFNL